MPLSADDVAYVAFLARLGLTDEERMRYVAQLDAILQHVARIDAVDTEGVSETAQVGGLVNVWREDRARPGIGVDGALGNAPHGDGDYFRVGAIQE